MKTLWEPAIRRGECTRYAALGLALGGALSLVAIFVSLLA